MPDTTKKPAVVKNYRHAGSAVGKFCNSIGNHKNIWPHSATLIWKCGTWEIGRWKECQGPIINSRDGTGGSSLCFRDLTQISGNSYVAWGKNKFYNMGNWSKFKRGNFAKKAQAILISEQTFGHHYWQRAGWGRGVKLNRWNFWQM